MRERRYLKRGFRLQGADGQSCRILREAGSGGTSLTYFGEEEILGQESVPVYLKELYPAGEDFVRQEDGTVTAATAEGAWILRELEQSFQREQSLGNQILKKQISGICPMTRLLRDEKTGNLYGVTYQCPPSVSFKELAGEERISLAGKVKIMLAACEPIRRLHSFGFCHNDISPGNLLLLGVSRLSEWKEADEEGLQAGIIDFACAGWMGEDRAGRDAGGFWEPIRHSFLTDGFSAPELYEELERDEEGKYTGASDIYSAAACFWYLLTGEPPYGGPDRERLEESLLRHERYPLKGELKAAHGRNPMEIPRELLELFLTFFKRGLAPREYRFETMDLVSQSLSDILAVIEGSYVSEHKLWENTRKQYLLMRKSGRLGYRIDKELLPLAAEGEKEGDRKNPKAVPAFLREWESSFLIGEGGEGKTTALLWMMDRLCQEENDVIAVYIELNRIPETAGDSFLEEYLAGFLGSAPTGFPDSGDLMAAAVRRRLFRRRRGGFRYLILLDGLNEMTFPDEEKRRRFLGRLNELLTKAGNVRLILTGRADEPGLDSGLRRLYLKGLADETVKKYLAWEETALWTVLHTPFFLTLYAGLSDRERVTGAGGILRRYFHERTETLDGTGEYGEQNINEDKFKDRLYCSGVSMKLARRFAVDFVLPKLGQAMTAGNLYYLEKKELMRLTEGCFTEMGGDRASGHEREEEFHFPAEWGREEIIRELAGRLLAAGTEKMLVLLTEQLGILAEGGDGLYGFYHQHIRDYFASVFLVNRLTAATELDTEAGVRLMDLYFDRRIWPKNVLRFAGEHLGLPLETPCFDGGKWRRGENRNPVMRNALELLRAPGRFSEELKRRRESRESASGTAEKNLLEMYRLCCRDKTRADLSGLNLSGLDLRGLCLPDVIWSRPDPLKGTEGHEDAGLYTDFTGAEYDPEMLTGKMEPERIIKAVCHFSEPALLVERELKDGFCLEERNLKDKTVRVYEEFSPYAARRLGYSEEGTFIWRQGGPGGRVITSIERSTGKKGELELEAGTFISIALFSGNRLGMALKHGKNRLYIGTADLALLSRGICQTDISPVRPGLSDLGLTAGPACELLDTEHALVSDGTGLWLLGTREKAARLLFSMKDWTKQPDSRRQLKWTLDRRNKTIYLLAAAYGQPAELMKIDPESGEMSLIREAPLSAFGEAWAGELHMAGENVVLLSGRSLYLWKTGEKAGSLVRTGAAGLRGRICLSCQETFSVWWNDVYAPDVKDSRFTEWLEVFSMEDGTSLYRQEARKREYTNGDEFLKALCQERVSAVEAPMGREGIRTVLDPLSGVLYFYRQEEEAWRCCGFDRIEADCSRALAIFADWEHLRLFVFDGKGIRAAHLYTGRREAIGGREYIPVPDISLVFPARASGMSEMGDPLKTVAPELKSAWFGPDGRRLLMWAWYQDSQVESDAALTKLIEWEYETGEQYDYPNEIDGKSVEQVTFAREDYEQGRDSGRRYLHMDMEDGICRIVSGENEKTWWKNTQKRPFGLSEDYTILIPGWEKAVVKDKRLLPADSKRLYEGEDRSQKDSAGILLKEGEEVRWLLPEEVPG